MDQPRPTAGLPSHHVPDEWVVAAANGTLSPAERVVFATHSTLCPICRARLEVAEALASRVLDTPVNTGSSDGNPAFVPNPPGELEALLARLDEPEPPPPALPDDPVLPWPVLEHTGPLASVSWSWLAPGIRGFDLPFETSGLPLRLIRMNAGTALYHRHAGAEAGVILAGGWDDQFGTYRRGDAAFLPADIEGVHEQRIHDDEDCVALVLNEARGIVDGLAGPIAKLLFKI